jgi:hypothetical protein
VLYAVAVRFEQAVGVLSSFVSGERTLAQPADALPEL